MTTDLLTIDRKIALAARALDTWRAEIAVDGRRDREDPLAGFGELARMQTIDAVASSTLAEIATTPALLLSTGEVAGATLRGSIDPLQELRAGATSWCAHLLLARELRVATVERARTMREDLDAESYGKATSMRAMLRALARPKQAGGVPEPRAASAIEDLSPQMLDAIYDEETQRREHAQTLGVHATCCFDPQIDAAAKAETFLAATDDEARDLLAFGLKTAGRATKSPTWVDVFAVRRAADVAEGWPSSLTPRWLAELARGTSLLEGFSVDAKVDAARVGAHADQAGLRLAPPTGAWSFAGSLRALGLALRIHGRDKKAPFSPHTPPHDRRPHVWGEAFYSLPTTTIFHARARNVGQVKGELSARRMSTTRLLERRHLALRVVLGVQLAKNKRSFREAFEGLAPRAIGADVPKELAAFLGAPGVLGPAEDAARFLAIEGGDLLARELRERFDVDWWRNPKAAAWVRDRCAR